MRKSFWCILLLSVIAGLLPAPTAPAQTLPIVVTDATGATVTIEALDRIASGSGDVTEIIAALGFYDRLVGIDNSSTYPPQALEEIQSIGFGRLLSVEPVAAVNPTVFFCTQTCSPLDALDQIRALGIPVVIVADDQTLGLDLPAQKIALVAAALGVPEPGQALIAQVQREIQWAQTATLNTANRPAVLHLYVRNRGLQLAGGAGTPAEVIIDGAGGIDAGAEIGVEYYQPLTPEILFTAYPDYLLFTSGSVESAGGIEAVMQIQGLADTPAAQNNQVIVMDTGYLLNLSVRTGQAMLDLAAQIHPDMTWELSVVYPYTYTDATTTAITIPAAPQQVLGLNALMVADLGKLGFHAELFSPTADPATSLILADAAEADLWQPLRDQGYTVIVIGENDHRSLRAIAAALNVPGRGAAAELLTRP